MSRYNLRGFINRLVSLFLLAWRKPWLAILFSFLIYSSITILNHTWGKTSPYPYFNYLADAFLHGQLHLRIVPVDTHDLVFFNGLYYLYWPPFPAVILMPFVAIWGVSISDVLYTLVIGSLNVGLMSILLKKAGERNLFKLSPERQGLLVLFFALGTVYITIIPFGRVWFTSQVISVTCLLLAYLSVLGFTGWKSFFLAGLSIAAAFSTRNSLILAGLWPAFYLVTTHRIEGSKKLVLFSALGIVPVLIAGTLLGYYNYARFGSPTDVGLAYHNMDPFFRAEYTQYGAFSLHYILKNVYYQFINYPFPIRTDILMGGSLFLLSPLFFSVFWALRNTDQRKNAIILLMTIALVYVPIALLMGTGWVQFGPRYTLDFIVPLMLLTGLGIGKWRSSILRILVCISIFQYLFGVWLLTNIF